MSTANPTLISAHLHHDATDRSFRSKATKMAAARNDLHEHICRFGSQDDAVDTLQHADAAAGNAVGANGTPTFFINGRKLVGAMPFESFKQVIDAELAARVAKK